MKIGIVGHGYVGRHLAKLFGKGRVHSVCVYDVAQAETFANRPIINSCDIVFIAVPTPSKESGECDTSAVEDAVSWITVPICIKSTVPPGTVERLCNKFNKKIVFSPEYVGETPFHKNVDAHVPELVVAGGDRVIAALVLQAYSDSVGPEPRYFATDAVTAELSKYMENCFFATKVCFVAQFYHLATLFGANFTEMREIWLADSRVGRSHSAIVGQPGFGGRCLPKDLAAIISVAETSGGRVDLLRAVEQFNCSIRTLVKDGTSTTTKEKVHVAHPV